MTNDMVKATSALATAMYILEIFIRVNAQAKECILGRTEILMTVSGKMGKRMAMEFGRAMMETVILVSGLRIWLMDTVSMSGKTGIAMKVNGVILYDMDKARMFLQTEMSSWVSTLMEKRKVMASIVGSTVTPTVELLSTEKRKAKDFGRSLKVKP